MLQNATKEYILATMYHEVVHAYLNSELNRLGQQQFEIEYPKIIIDHTSIVDAVGGQLIVNVFRYYPDHQEAAAYIDTLHDILISYNPNLSPKTASSLSKSGMVDLTPEEMEINSRERGIDKTLGQQKELNARINIMKKLILFLLMSCMSITSAQKYILLDGLQVKPKEYTLKTKRLIWYR